MRLPLFFLTPALLVSFAVGQASTLTKERVLSTVTWLAADERAGRATGSPEILAAGEWIAARFAAAGLTQLQEGSWRHEFPLTGAMLDSTAMTVKLVRKHRDEVREFVLVPNVDVRQWAAADVLAGEDEACTVALFDDPVLQRLLTADSARRPILCEVGDDHAYWLAAKGTRRVLGGRRQAARPLFLLRKGILPPAPVDGSEVAWTTTWSVAAPEKVDVPQFNIVGLLPGTTKKDEYVIVSSHYDHLGVGREVGGDRIYNGADDNASGTTGVILLAEAFAKEPCARSLLFVCFTGEERGLLGSREFCARPPLPLDKVVANLNLEMLGRPEPGNEGKAWITGADLSDFAAIATESLQRGGVQVIEFQMAAQLFAQSDNWSLAQKGVVAHSLSAGSLHRDYHQPSDEVSRLDVDHMTVILRGLFEFTKDLGNREQAPQWNEKGEARLQKTRR